ncbi:hypothetical protein N474_12535 [Pseudoalteromonas luteoviolacea CPMOR-2]|uniref:Uncharacterized protein n=1 Tax=Pseudoalteromonas luteoviolacea DSM 6061 TaxID=1365250 RepID=A0A167CDH7_9GAMM|nr:hypothetical protein [Pseudoalteromonas luteoviolacea]KZN47532.1 hypothetical protein N475_06540 [Pseudoalteromonas luteoviolacea DSM 6061]KZN56100.1 hypothetical protein N474_12535 [Pseudoalteromonas luteoviolacea CPMOR-2]MBE0388572.1 hypothetical protein [Pseudoalteromonas luteoviolacea DSM 6061]
MKALTKNLCKKTQGGNSRSPDLPQQQSRALPSHTQTDDMAKIVLP